MFSGGSDFLCYSGCSLQSCWRDTHHDVRVHYIVIINVLDHSQRLLPWVDVDSILAYRQIVQRHQKTIRRRHRISVRFSLAVSFYDQVGRRIFFVRHDVKREF